MSTKHKATTIVATLAVATVGWFAYGALYPDPSFVCDRTATIAQSGDTVYAIAEAKCEGELSLAVAEAFRINGTLSVGEAVVMPSREGCRLVWVGVSSPTISEDCS